MLARKYVIRIIASVIFSVTSFISLVIMTRYVGVAYGMMMWGMSLVATFSAALDAGFHSANIKMVSENKDISKCVSTYLAIRIAVSIVTASLVLLSALLLSDGFPAEFWSVTAVFVIYFVIDNFALVIKGTFTGRMEAGKESVVLTVEYLVRSAALIIMAVAGASAVALSFGYVIGAAFALVFALVLFRPLKVRLVRPAFFKEYANFAAPLVLPVILIAVISYVDKVMIGAFYDEFEVGLYTAAAGAVYSLITIGLVMNGLLLSHMSKLNAKGEKEEARKTMWMAQKYLAVLIMPATVFLLMFGNEAAEALFGADFAGSGPILSVLALGIYITVLTGLLSQVLFSMDRTRQYGRSATVHAVLTLALFFILIPGSFFSGASGGVGAAAGLFAGKLLLLFLLGMTLRRLGAPGVYPRTYIHLISAAAVAAMLYLLKLYLEPSGIVPLVLLALLSVLIYAAILFLLREITRNDIRFIRETMNPKNIYNDIRNDIRKQ